MNDEIEIPPDFFKGIDEVSVDASSIIYLLKIGLLGTLCAEINLVATQGIVDEVDFPRLPVEIIPLKREELTNDQTVVELASLRFIPLLSEDLEVLQIGAERGLSYYNSYMMLNYLFLKRRINFEEYTIFLQRLLEVSHYGSQILIVGEIVFNKIKNYLKAC